MRTHARLVVLLAASALALVPQPSHAQRAGDVLEQRVDSLFATYTRQPSPGLAVGVVRDGRLVFAKGYGLADLEHRVPITPSTVFDVASVSKQFGGMAIAMLVEEGKVRLDDDVRRYLPELPELATPITIRHLVHHVSGLRDWPGTLAVAGWRFDDVISFDQILRFAGHQRTLNFVPGAEYTYSNTGYNLLAAVVERVSGQSFRRWTHERLFAPLGMSRTFFRDDHTVVIPDRAFGYARGADGAWHATTNNLTALGSSSLMSSVEDLARWVINFDSARVGGRAALDRARTRGVLNDGSSIPYAYGLSHGEYRGAPTVAHSGSWASFVSYLVHFPAQRAGVVVLANSPIVNPSRAAFQLADVFLGSSFTEPPPPAPRAPAAVPVRAELLDAYAGIYRLGPGWYVEIRRQGDALFAQATNEGRVPMLAASPAEFWVAAYGTTMTFVRGTDGVVSHLVFRGKPAPRLPDRPASTAPLTDFVGEYFSEELDATYRVELRRDSLQLVHRRHGSLPLARRYAEDFGTPQWFLKSVAFTRDPAGRVAGFILNVDERSRDIAFRRVR